jgi:hypothetical protein
MIRTQIQLTEEQARRVRALARREGVSMAEIIRRGVEQLLAADVPARADLWNAAAALVGAFRDADDAEDVARRHDEYLDGSFS